MNIHDKHQIGVVDLVAGKVINTWSAGRRPGIFYVFNRDGKVVTQKPCVNINDDMTWDPVMRRVYVSGTQGLSIFHQDSADTYTEIANIPTNGGKTSYYVPQTHQFFVIHPKTDVDIAGLQVYRVNQ